MKIAEIVGIVIHSNDSHKRFLEDIFWIFIPTVIVYKTQT